MGYTQQAEVVRRLKVLASKLGSHQWGKMSKGEILADLEWPSEVLDPH